MLPWNPYTNQTPSGVTDAQTRTATQSTMSQQETTKVPQAGNMSQNIQDVRTPQTQLIPSQLRNLPALQNVRQTPTPPMQPIQEQEQQRHQKATSSRQIQQQQTDEQGNTFFSYGSNKETSVHQDEATGIQQATAASNITTGTDTSGTEEQPPNGVIGMQVSTPNRDNRRPAQAKTGGTPNSKRGRGTNNGVTAPANQKQPPPSAQELDNPDINSEDTSNINLDLNSVEQLSLLSTMSKESTNTAPEGWIVVTEKGFTYVNNKNSPRRKHLIKPLATGNGGRGGRGFGGGNLTGHDRRYRKAIHPLVTGVFRDSRKPPQPPDTRNTATTATASPTARSNNGVYQGGYYQALAEFDEEETLEEAYIEDDDTPNSMADYDYRSQPGDIQNTERHAPLCVPTSLKEAVVLMNRYKTQPMTVGADPAGGHLHCE